MAKRSLQQIEESLRSKFAETSDDDLKAFVRDAENLDDPYHVGGRGKPQQIDIGLGGAGSKTSSGKPRVSIQKAKELGIVKSDPKVWRRAADIPTLTDVIPSAQPKVWRRSEPAAEKPSIAPASQTPQEKLIAKAQAHTKATGEPVAAVTNPFVTKVLDKLFPEPAVRKEPTMGANTPVKDYLGRTEPSIDEARTNKKEPNYDEVIQNPNVRKMLDLIGRAEGADYNTIVGGKQFKDFSKHPNKVGLTTQQGPSTAAGKYQITGTNWKKYASRLGLTDFGPESQDKIAAAMLHDRGALNSVIDGDFLRAIKKTGSQWTSLPSSSIKQGMGPHSWDWVKKNLATLGTDTLAVATGSGSARAADEIPKKNKEKDKIPVPTEPKSTAVSADKTTMRVTPDQAKKMPAVDMLGHILPTVQFNPQGGIKGVGTKPYTLPDGTVITNKRVLADIRALQQRNAEPAPAVATQKAVSGKVGVIPAPTVPATKSATAAPTNVVSQKVEQPKIERPAAAPKAATSADKSTTRQEFEKVFATARAEKGPGQTFTFRDKEYTTNIAGEQPIKKPTAADKAANAFASSLDKINQPTSLVASTPNTAAEFAQVRDRMQPITQLPAGPEVSDIQKTVSSFNHKQEVDRLRQQLDVTDPIEQAIKDKSTGTPPDAPLPTDAEIKASTALAQKHVADIEKELADKALVKESINTALQDILKLAGRLK